MIGRRIALAALASFLSAGPALAESGEAPNSPQRAICGDRDEIVAGLRSDHGEQRMAIGLQRNTRVMETFANPETGTWTIIMTLPTGEACLVAAGHGFEQRGLRKVAPTSQKGSI